MDVSVKIQTHRGVNDLLPNEKLTITSDGKHSPMVRVIMPSGESVKVSGNDLIDAVKRAKLT